MWVPIVNSLGEKVIALASLLLLSLSPIPLFSQMQNNNVEIVSWDGANTYQARVNDNDFIIYLEDNSGDEDIEPEEADEKVLIPGKVKIIFKDFDKSGTSLVYERDMQGGEISEVDQIYIDKVLNSIEKFHRENHTALNNKIKDTVNNFWKSLKKKK